MHMQGVPLTVSWQGLVEGLMCSNSHNTCMCVIVVCPATVRLAHHLATVLLLLCRPP
jgi:hypothetical protein